MEDRCKNETLKRLVKLTNRSIDVIIEDTYDLCYKDRFQTMYQFVRVLVTEIFPERAHRIEWNRGSGDSPRLECRDVCPDGDNCGPAKED